MTLLRVLGVVAGMVGMAHAQLPPTIPFAAFDYADASMDGVMLYDDGRLPKPDMGPPEATSLDELLGDLSLPKCVLYDCGWLFCRRACTR